MVDELLTRHKDGGLDLGRAFEVVATKLTEEPAPTARLNTLRTFREQGARCLLFAIAPLSRAGWTDRHFESFNEAAKACVEETAPPVHQQGADNVWKDARLDNGITVMVPPFIDVGERIRVDVETARYVERARAR